MDTVDAFGCAAVQLAGNCYAGNTQSVLAEDASLYEVAPELEYEWTEGPATDSQGNVYFTDIPNSSIYKIDTNERVSLFRDNARQANGLYFDNNDQLYIAETTNAEIRRIDPKTVSEFQPDGNIETLVNEYMGSPLNQTNDLWIAPNGDIYFTDPCYSCFPSQNGEHVYRLPQGTHSAVRVTNDRYTPNGIIGTADGKLLFVSDASSERKIYKYEIQDDGSLSQSAIFADIGGDGMTIDCENNIYITARDSSNSYFISVRNIDGIEIEKIMLPENSANITFGGAELDTLFITATTSIYAIRTRVRGIPFIGVSP